MRQNRQPIRNQNEKNKLIANGTTKGAVRIPTLLPTLTLDLIGHRLEDQLQTARHPCSGLHRKVQSTTKHDHRGNRGGDHRVSIDRQTPTHATADAHRPARPHLRSSRTDPSHDLRIRTGQAADQHPSPLQPSTKQRPPTRFSESWPLRPIRKNALDHRHSGEPITTVNTDASARATEGSATRVPSSSSVFINVQCPLDLLILGLARWISVASLASRSSAWSRFPKPQPVNDHHCEPPRRPQRQGCLTWKESDSHAVSHPRPSRLDRTQYLTCCFSVGVAGFEPTASSSRSNECAALTSAFQRFDLFRHPSGSTEVRCRTW
jgi:hypothetical protein